MHTRGRETRDRERNAHVRTHAHVPEHELDTHLPFTTSRVRMVTEPAVPVPLMPDHTRASGAVSRAERRAAEAWASIVDKIDQDAQCSALSPKKLKFGGRERPDLPHPLSRMACARVTLAGTPVWRCTGSRERHAGVPWRA